MVTGTTIALLMGASPQIAASIMPKSVTTPIAMAVGAALGAFRLSALFASFLSVSSGRCLAIRCLMRCVFAPRPHVGWQWAPLHTPWEPLAVRSWTIRKVRLALWRWSFAGLSLRWLPHFCSRLFWRWSVNRLFLAIYLRCVAHFSFKFHKLHTQ